MMSHQKYDVLLMYVLENTKKADHLDQENIFKHLNEIVIK